VSQDLLAAQDEMAVSARLGASPYPTARVRELDAPEEPYKVVGGHPCAALKIHHD
jgi:hypothetical protein